MGKPKIKILQELVDIHTSELADHPTVKSFGAKGDGVTDDTISIQNAIDSLAVKKGTLFFPSGTYIISDTIKVPTAVVLMGATKEYTAIKDNGLMLDKPLLANSNYGTSTPNNNIEIRNIAIVSINERTVWTVCFQNTNYLTIDNCVIGDNDGGTASTAGAKHGLAIVRANGYGGSLFVAKITNSRFVSAVLKCEATDSYITQNELWGNGRDCAVDVSYTGNTVISHNQIVGGKTYGAILTTTSIRGLKILNNFFDGSYYTIDTKWGISATTLDKCINNFWTQKAGGISVNSMTMCIVTNNVFDECDNWGDGYSDIKMKSDVPQSSWGNIFSQNTHMRHKQTNKVTGVASDRSTVSPPPVLDLYQIATGYAESIVSNNTILYAQFYSPSKYNGGKFTVRNNGNTHFIDATNLPSIYRPSTQTIYFTLANLTVNLNTNPIFNGSGRSQVMFGKSGVVTALGMYVNPPKIGGSLTIEIAKNGTPTGFSYVMGSGITGYTLVKNWSAGTELAFIATDALSLIVTTDGSYATDSTNAEFIMRVAFD